MNSPHNSSPLTNFNIDQPSVGIPESGLMRHDDPESTGQRTDLESITNSGKRSRDEQENKDLLSVLLGPDSHSKRARRGIQDIEDANETLIVTTSPDLAETQTQQPLPLQLSTQEIPAPSRSLDGHNDLPNLVSGNILDMDTSDDTEPEIEDNHCIFNVPQQVLLNETTSREDEVMDSFELHPSTSVLATERDGTDDTEIPSLSDTTAPLRNRTIPVVYGLPNIGVACHAIAPTQLLAATASVLQCVEETRSNVRGVNNPSMLISRGIVSVTNPSEQDRKDGVKCLDRAHWQLAPDQARLQDDAGDFMDKALFALGLDPPNLRKMYTCTSCSHETIDENDVHGYHSAVWHIKATDKSVEEGIRKVLRFDVKKLCSECSKNTIHDVIIKVQKPQTLPVIAIVIDRVGAGGRVNLDRVSFPLTLRGVGLGGNRRLVGICSHLGKSSRFGHYVATARRFVPVKRPTNDDDDANLAEVPLGTFLQFDDGCIPRPVSLQDIVDDESEYKTSVLLYEIAPDDYQDEGGFPLSVQCPSSASTVSIDEDTLAPNLTNLAILKEKILFRGDIREGRPTEARLGTVQRSDHSVPPDSGSLRREKPTQSFIETPHYEESTRCIFTVFNPSLTEMPMLPETRIELYDLVVKICNASEPNNGSDYLYQLLRETIQRTVIAEESRRRTAQSNGREIDETEQSLCSAYTNRRKNALIIFRPLNEYASRMQLPRIEQIYLDLDELNVRVAGKVLGDVRSTVTQSDHDSASHFPSEAAGGTRTTDNSTDSTAADSSAVCLTFTDICEDAAAGDDLGQRAFSPLQAFRAKRIAEGAGLYNRRDEKRAADEQSDRPSPRKKVFVREKYDEEMIFQCLWEDFKSEIFSESRLEMAIVALQTVIIVSKENDDFDNVVKYETMMIQIEEARAKKDGGLALRELKFNWKIEREE
jgi:hypothetical protein